jgi:surfactin synthase thioesterase subunit
MSKINLFCFPFAGGNSFSYRIFEPNVGTLFKMEVIEYPGRGTRAREACITDMSLLVQDLFARHYPSFCKGTYAFYGHSMGAIVAFALIKKMSAEKCPLPIHLVVTGAGGPAGRSEIRRNRHLMDKQDFLKEIRELDGCPEDILQNDELLDYFEPILRSDFELSETYDYQHDQPLTLPITVITGALESIPEEDIQLWQQETLRPVDFIKMPGKHFFIYDDPGQIMHIVNKKLHSHTKILHL